MKLSEAYSKSELIIFNEKKTVQTHFRCEENRK